MVGRCVRRVCERRTRRFRAAIAGRIDHGRNRTACRGHGDKLAAVEIGSLQRDKQVTLGYRTAVAGYREKLDIRAYHACTQHLRGL